MPDKRHLKPSFSYRERGLCCYRLLLIFFFAKNFDNPITIPPLFNYFENNIFVCMCVWGVVTCLQVQQVCGHEYRGRRSMLVIFFYYILTF